MENIKDKFNSQEAQIKQLLSQINTLTNQVSKYKSLLKNINFLTEDFKLNNNVKNYEEVINSSFLLPETKREYISHFRAYENYIIDKNRDEIIMAHKEQRDPCLKNLYSPDNVWEYIMNNEKIQNNTKKQRLKKFLSIIRKASGDASLMYSGNLPKTIKPKIKHFITDEEILNYTNYLKENGLLESLIIVELLYKFGFRIGALAKIKSKNLSNDNNLIVLEKNSEIVKKKLLDSTANKIRQLIKIQRLKDDDYIFFPYKFKEDNYKRSKFLSSYIKKSMIESKAFPNNDLEDISAHCFRATLAVKKFKESGALAAKEALNHKRISTTLSHYIKINERNLELYEEKKYMNNRRINSAFKFNSKEKRETIEQNSSEDSNLSDESNNPSSNLNKEEIEDDLFSINYETEYKEENNLFLRRKRKQEKSIEKKEKKSYIVKENDLIFTSPLDESLEKENLEKQFVKDALLESGRTFLSSVENKKESYNCANYSKSYIDLKANDSNSKIINDIIIKSQQCIFDFVSIKKIKQKYVIYAKTNIKKNQILLEATGQLILASETRFIKFDKKDPYIKLIPFYFTKNKLRDRVLVTDKKSNIIVFMNIAESNEPKINCSLFLFIDEKNKCHLLLKAIKAVKKDQLLYLNKEDLKIRLN